MNRASAFYASSRRRLPGVFKLIVSALASQIAHRDHELGRDALPRVQADRRMWLVSPSACLVFVENFVGSFVGERVVDKVSDKVPDKGNFIEGGA
jgi:hypothetical protein